MGGGGGIEEIGKGRGKLLWSRTRSHRVPVHGQASVRTPRKQSPGGGLAQALPRTRCLKTVMTDGCGRRYSIDEIALIDVPVMIDFGGSPWTGPPLSIGAGIGPAEKLHPQAGNEQRSQRQPLARRGGGRGHRDSQRIRPACLPAPTPSRLPAVPPRLPCTAGPRQRSPRQRPRRRRSWGTPRWGGWSGARGAGAMLSSSTANSSRATCRPPVGWATVPNTPDWIAGCGGSPAPVRASMYSGSPGLVFPLSARPHSPRPCSPPPLPCKLTRPLPHPPGLRAAPSFLRCWPPGPSTMRRSPSWSTWGERMGKGCVRRMQASPGRREPHLEARV
jgi:hypothetical protein